MVIHEADVIMSGTATETRDIKTVSSIMTIPVANLKAGMRIYYWL